MTWVIKTRGAPGLVASEYLCPVHGRFTVLVADPPDVAACPIVAECYRDIDRAEFDVPVCGERAEWVISAPLARVNPIEAIKGKYQKPERPTWTDTRNVGEGQPLYEWKEDRAKIWEEKRKQDVVAFAREHNERVIGGD